MSAVDVTLRIGGVFASDREAVIRTVLGSCIAACLYDPVSRVGGMNHYMLPYEVGHSTRMDCTRFGVQAMEVLIGTIQRHGGRRDRLQAKLFGGAHVLNTKHSDSNAPSQNIEFIERFVRDEGITVVARDLGGFLPRRVHFYPVTGRVLVKRLGDSALGELRLEERRYAQSLQVEKQADVTLFEDD